jgi:hypothetical protein
MALPLNAFPGITQVGVVNPAILAIATIINAEGVEAVQGIPPETIAWAKQGTRITKMNVGQGLIPIRLTSLLGFDPFEGERHYHELSVSTVKVGVTPYSLNVRWPVQLNMSDIPALMNLYGISGIANDVVDHGRAHMADLVASLMIAGQTNSVLSMVAKAYTLPQPGLANGLPLFSDGATSGSTTHYSNPLDINSRQFANLYGAAGKITDVTAGVSVFGKMLTDMTQVPHPSKQNMTLGLQVTDVIGGTNMRQAFNQIALQQLHLDVGGATYAAATTNIYSQDMLAKMAAVTSASGSSAVRYWIAPQLDAHPYLVAHPTYQMWYAVSQTRPTLKWAELAGPNADFIPQITLFGDGSEECRKTRKISLLGDLDAGIAAGLPHCIKAYFETALT